MSTRTTALALLPLVGACATQEMPPQTPATAAHGLVGVWCNSNDGGSTCWAYDEFRTNGTFEACGRTEDDPRPFRGEGTYSVNGKLMCYVVTQATQNFWLGPGARYCTEITGISSSSHRYRDLDTGAEFELTRVPSSAKSCEPTR